MENRHASERVTQIIKKIRESAEVTSVDPVSVDTPTFDTKAALPKSVSTIGALAPTAYDTYNGYVNPTSGTGGGDIVKES